MNGLQLAEQRQPLQWLRQQPFSTEPDPIGRQEVFSGSARAWWVALFGLIRTAPSQPPATTAPRTESPYARLYPPEDVLSALAPLHTVHHVELGAHEAEVPLEVRGRRARLTGSRAVQRVPYVDRAREMKWIREHQAEYAGQWVALDGDRMIAAGLDAKAVFAAAKAASVGRPLFVHMEPKDALPFGGW